MMSMLISDNIYEHHGYAKGTGDIELSPEQYDYLIKQEHYKKYLQYNEKVSCYCIKCFKDSTKINCQTNFFIGIDWVVEKQLAIYIKPKLNKNNLEIDYLSMLFEALETPENFEHLDGLCEVYFNKPTISITQGQDLLTPFLIVQFLQILKKIVKKGLKKSYYSIISPLDAKVKGKILVNKSIKESITKNKLTRTICQYQVFGINCDENKILKKAYTFCSHLIPRFNVIFKKNAYLKEIEDVINFIRPAFDQVSNDINIDTIKTFKSNVLYKEYDQALKIASLLLKSFSYNISQTEHERITTYPFWIDMSKLFELYAYSKLRKVFPNSAEIIYQKKMGAHIPDFLLKSQDAEGNPLRMVIDAKYKPQYHTKAVDKPDMKQIAGYARLEQVHQILDVDKDRNIDCLVIYANQQAETDLTLDNLKAHKEKNYTNFYKIGLKLPEIELI